MKHHSDGLRKLNVDENLISDIASDFHKADLSTADRAMLEYVAKLTREPWTITEPDVEKVRAAGFSDAAILDIVQITGYFAFVNRLADGLGVELEHYWEDPDGNG